MGNLLAPGCGTGDCGLAGAGRWVTWRMISWSAKSSMSPSEGSDISTSLSDTSSILGWDMVTALMWLINVRVVRKSCG